MKEIKNLFGEVLSDEIESRVVKNKTLAFKKKSKATKEYHYIPIKNIKHRKETKQFLQEMLGLLEKYSIDQIIYAIGLELTGGKHLPDFYQKSKSDFTITIPEKENSNKSPNKKQIQKFKEWLVELGLNATVRRTLGGDINASCGQLRRREGGESRDS